MQNGWLFIQSYALGAKKQLKEVLVVTLWHVYAEKVSAIYVQSHGNQIIKTILNVIYIRKAPNNK